MSHRCTYCDDGYCMKKYGKTCPYDSTDEQHKCLEYEPKENYIATFTREALKELNRFDIHSDTWEQWKVCEGKTNDFTRNKKTIKELQSKAVQDFAAKLKTKTHNYYPSIDSYCCSRLVVLVKDIDELLEEYTK